MNNNIPVHGHNSYILATKQKSLFSVSTLRLKQYLKTKKNKTKPEANSLKKNPVKTHLNIRDEVFSSS